MPGEPTREFDPASYWEDRLGGDFSLHGVGYRGLGLRYNEWLYRVRARVFRRAVRAIGIPLESARVLDVGSGTGFYVEQWQRLGIRSIVASDLTAVACDRLRQRFPSIEVRRLDLGDAEDAFPTAAFDVASAFDVLFHIVDDERFDRAVANLGRWVRPGGYLVCSDNFLRAGERRGRHQVSRSRERIEGSLAAAGFRIVERRATFVLMNAPVDSDSRWHWRFWRGLEAVVRHHDVRGAVVGAALYPLEAGLTARRREGPSTELVVCLRT